jgi:cytochrome c556
LLFTSSQLFARGDVIKERRKLLKANSKDYKAIRKAVKAKDFATIEAKAKVIAANMEKVPNLFPEGSTSKNSRTKAAIWKKWDRFVRGTKSNKEVTEFLAEAAAAKDGEKVAILAKGVDCKSCHRSFRKKKKKKKK